MRRIRIIGLAVILVGSVSIGSARAETSTQCTACLYSGSGCPSGQDLLYLCGLVCGQSNGAACGAWNPSECPGGGYNVLCNLKDA